MYVRSISVLFISLLFICPVFAETPQSTDDRLGLLIHNLGSTRFQVRRQAAVELAASGAPALKALKTMPPSGDEEVRATVTKLVHIIERRLQNEELLRAPKLHLQYVNRPLDEAIVDLSQKSGLPFALDPKSGRNPKQPITLDTGNVPFWEAVEQFLAATRLVEVFDPDKQFNPIVPDSRSIVWSSKYGPRSTPLDTRIRLIETGALLPASTDSSVRVKVLPRDVPGNSVTKGSNEITLWLDVLAMPGLAWQGCLNAEIHRAMDDQGLELPQAHGRTAGFDNGLDVEELGIQIAPQGGQILIQRQFLNGLAVDGKAAFELPLRGHARRVPVTLLGSDFASKTLKELRGVITAQVLTRPQPLLTVENVRTISVNDHVQGGGCQIEITSLRIAPDSMQMQLSVQIPASLTSMGATHSVSAEPKIMFQDVDGNPVASKTDLIEQSPQNHFNHFLLGVEVAIARKEPGPIKMVVVGRMPIALEIPFHLKNVQLP